MGSIEDRLRLWDGPIAHLSNVGMVCPQRRRLTRRPSTKDLQTCVSSFASLSREPEATHAMVQMVESATLEPFALQQASSEM